MAIGGTKKTNPEKASTTEVPSADASDFSAFLYLRDLLSAADSASLSLTLAYKLLTYTDLPEEISQVLDLVPETAQIRAEIPDFLDRLELLKAAAEGAMQTVAAIELSTRAHELNLTFN